MTPLKVATWNVHGFLSAEGVRAPGRAVSVLRELGADIVGLQEAQWRDAQPGSHGELDHLAAAADLKAIRGPCRRGAFGNFGNALLTRFPATHVRHVELGVPGREPRGVLDVRLDAPGTTLRVMVTHFGLRASERRRQVSILLDLLRDADGEPLVLLGDFNEWLPRSRTVRRLDRALGPGVVHRSFPTRLPLLPLDRIWVRPGSAIVQSGAWRSRATRTASDHLPVWAELNLRST